MDEKANDIFRAAFAKPREPRSEAYKAGVRAAICSRLRARQARCPYKLGTAEADAWFAGTKEGMCLAEREDPQESGI